VRWGSDLNELLLRYGWPISWERDDFTRPFDPIRARIISHNAPRPRAFLPPRRLLEHPEEITLEAWDIHPDRPRSNYAPAYARVVEPIDDAQVAAFPRGREMVVVAAFGTPRGDGRRQAMAGDSNAAVDQRTGALVFTADPSARPVMSRAEGTEPFRLAVTVPHRAGLVSLEVMEGTDTVRVARGRLWLHVSDELTVSGPLLFDISPQDSLPGTLEAVVGLVRPTPAARPAEGIGVYWEVADWGPEAVLARFALTVTRTGEGWLKRFARAIRVAKAERPSVSLSWEEALPGGAQYYPRALAVGLPEGQPGSYLLRIEVRVADRVAAGDRRVEVGW